MHKLLQRIASDDAGTVVSIELVLVAVLALIGLTAGLISCRDAVVSELSDVAGTVQDINQSYSLNGVVGHSATFAGSNFLDANDHCDDDDDTAGQSDNCIAFNGAADGGLSADTVTNYTNSDNTTDISASQNATNLKWALEPGQDKNADNVTKAIIDCIKAGHVVEITWTDSAGNTNTFSATSFMDAGPGDFVFIGINTGPSASGKIQSVTAKCPN